MSNFEENISDAILKSIDVIVDKKISELNYNETIKGVIIDDSRASKGVYNVKYETSDFIAYTTDTSLKNGDLVQVLISSNDSSDTRTIINKIVTEEDEYLRKNDYTKYIDVTNNLLDTILDTNKNLLANGVSEEKLLWSNVSTHNFSEYTKLNLEADIQCLLQNAKQGIYGFRIEITHDDTILNLYFKNDEMLGNSLNYLGFMPQRKIFDLRNYGIKEITNISLFFYQEKGSFLDEKNNLIPDKDSFNNNLPSNIFVDNIKLSFGFFNDELTPGVDSVVISPAEGYSLSYDVEPDHAVVELKWLHWNEDNTKLLTKEEILKDSRYHIEWYQYQLYTEAVEAIQKQKEQHIGEFANIIDENRMDLIESGLIQNLGCPHINNNNWQRLYNYDDNFECEVVLDGDASTQEQIRAFVYYTDSTTVFPSNVITFEGENKANPKTTTKQQGIYLTLDDNSEGNYYLYTSTGILKNEDKKARILTVSYYTADGEEVNLLEDTNYSIEWTGPKEDSQSMLINCQEGSKRTEYIYAIAEKYNPTALDNTITCTITFNNETLSYNTYITQQEFHFGYANSSNTENEVVIDYKDKLLKYNNVYYSKNAVQFGSTEPEAFILRNFDTVGKETDELEPIEWHLVLYEINNNNAQKIIINQSIEEEIPDLTEDYQLVMLEENNIIYLLPPKEGFNNNYYLILCAEIAGSAIEFPIPITANQYTYNYITGANFILYRQLGIPIYNKEPYCLYDHNGDIINEELHWIYKNDSWYSLNENNILVPSQVYLEQHGPVGVICENSDNEIVWVQPITISESAFSSTTLSSWDGQTVQINDNSVTAPMIMAGKKDSNGKFTGVTMGDLLEDTEGAIPLTGLYGFRQGNPAFGFTEEGTGFIGEAGIGRIEFDGRHGWITSGDFLQKTYINPNTNENINYYDTTSFLDLTSEGIVAITKNIDDNNLVIRSNVIAKLGDNFYIYRDGNNTDRVIVKGNLTATTLTAKESGQIASFMIDENWLYSYDTNNRIALGKTGIYLGRKSNSDDYPFYVTNTGTIYSEKGSVGGWHLASNTLYSWYGEGNNRQYYYLTSSPGENNPVATFGKNFYILNNGTMVASDSYLKGNLSIAGKVKGLFKLIKVQRKYTFSKNIRFKEITGKVSLGTNFSAVGIVAATTGSFRVRFIKYEITPGGSYTIKLSKDVYTKGKVSSTVSLTFLCLRADQSAVAFENVINTGQFIIGQDGDEIDGTGDTTIENNNVKITVPGFHYIDTDDEEDAAIIDSDFGGSDSDDTETDTASTSEIVVEVDSNSNIPSVNLTNIAQLHETNVFTQNNSFTKGTGIQLTYHGSEVLTRSDLAAGGGFNFSSKAGLDSNNIFTGSNRFSSGLYYGNASNTNTEVATHQWVENKNYATETWVYDNYCEVNGPTIRAIQDRLTALENA